MNPMLLWGVIGVLFFGGLFFLWQWWQSEEVDEDEADAFDAGSTTQAVGPDGQKTLADTLATTTEEHRGARKSRIIALKQSLEKSLETRHGMADASSKDRLKMPWFLLIGGEGSGKTTLLANTGLPLPYGPAFDVDSKKRDAGRWWLYEDAVVLEAPAALPGVTATGTTLVPEQTQPINTSEGWNTLLHMLSRERPDSPLNGIIVAVSAEELLAARVDPQKMIDQGERIRVFLERTRSTLGVRLPLHLIVTKCDTLAGFRSFATNLPPERREDIFGWSNPNRVDAPFNPDWVDLAMAGMKSELEDLRDEVLAAPEELVDADGLFVFVNSFGELQEPLKEFVTKVFDGNERRASLFLRGVYFCGDTAEKAETKDEGKEKIRATLAISAEMVLSGKTKGHNLVFLRSLFQQKIFREAGLARPLARFRLSRDRRVVLAQAAALVFLFVGGAGLYTSLNGYRAGGTLNPGLRHDAEAVTAMLAGMAIDIDEVKHGSGVGAANDRRLRDAAVIELVSEMRNVEAIRRSAFIPASWFSPLPDDIRRSMVAGIESIVLPVSRERLQERVGALLADTAAVLDLQSLPGYLGEIRTLNRHIAMYNALAAPDSGSVGQLASLLDYLYAERPLEGDSSFTSPDFQAALREASAPRLVLPPAMVRSVVDRSVALTAGVARSAAQQLAGPGTASDAEADLEALRGLRALVELTDRRTGLVATVSDSAIFGMRIARMLEDSITAGLRAAALRLWRDSLTAEVAENRLRTFVNQLFQLRLMERPTQSAVAAEIPPRQRMRWDVGRLELVTALRGEMDKAMVLVATSFPNQSPERFRRAFALQLRSRAVDAAAGAQRFSALTLGDTLELKASVANLDLAGPRILRAARALDTLGAGGEGRALVAAATRHAEQVLVLAKTLLEQGRYFVPNTTLMSRWNGVIPISHPAMGIEDNDTLRLIGSLSANLRSAFDIARYATPAVRFLRRTGADTVRLPKLLAEWDAITSSVDRMERGDMVGSTLAQLHTFIRDGMGQRDLASCAAAVAASQDTAKVLDAFQLKRRQYRMAMAGRCSADAVGTAIVAYQRLRSAFATRVAGKYPFADSLRDGVPDASASDVREVMRAYDAFVSGGWEYAMRADARLQVNGRAAFDFLDQLGRTRAFFAPVMDNERREPEFLLVVGEGDLERAERWTYGDAVRLLAADADSSGAQPEVTVSGAWAAIRAARRSGVEPVRLFHPDSRAELPLPAFPVSAPDIRR